MRASMSRTAAARARTRAKLKQTARLCAEAQANARRGPQRVAKQRVLMAACASCLRERMHAQLSVKHARTRQAGTQKRTGVRVC
eukprot:676661-Pleurochrysis_carterae.AAC.1